jgi:hypothetical protein
MRDLHRWALLAALLALAACTPKQPKPPKDDFTADTVGPSQDVAWPTRQRACGDTGNWCGPLPQVQPLAPEEAGGDEEPACPDAFLREPFTYELDEESTAETMSGNCCYHYRDDSCRQP